jgi:Reverse transcriptase-like
MNTQQLTAFQVSKPNKSVWSYWTKFLHELVFPKTRRLKTPLGPWTAHVNTIRRKFPLYRDIEYLYKKQNQSYIKKNIISGEREKSIKLPNTVIPCIQTVTGNIIPEYDLVVVEDSKETYKINLPTLTLQNNTIIVTDASVHGEIAAYSWVIADPKGEVLFQYQQRISETSISSFRAEAIGVLSALKETYFIIQQQQVTWTLYCDNLSVIKRLNYIQHQEPKIEWIDSDVLLAIKKYIPKGGKFCHVKGHQQHLMDNSIPEKLNILVDKHANEEIQGNPVNNLIEYVMNIKGLT